MKTPAIVILLLILISCGQSFLGPDPSNSRVAVFDEFWKGVDANWPEFETKKVNWDSVYSANRPLVNAVTNDNDLIVIMQNVVNILKDEHTSVYPKGSKKIGYYPPYPSNFYGFSWIVSHYLPGYRKNNTLIYGLVNKDVGYIYISTFFNSEDQYAIIDQIIQDFGSVKGIIIDVRQNSGGNGSNSLLIASRFTDQNRTYGYEKKRINAARNMMTDFIPLSLERSGSISFSGKVAVLTNRVSYSATEDFVLMMKSLPNVKQIGDYTGGGSGTRPILKELPMGWTYRVSSVLLCDINKVPISKGITPDIFIQLTKADSLQGKDTIIEKAIAEVLK